jgi:hypothetical protein
MGCRRNSITTPCAGEAGEYDWLVVGGQPDFEIGNVLAKFREEEAGGNGVLYK